jgi:alginate O-acetyltransferase complex protein AlgI
LNIVSGMMIAGLWHGADWQFPLWGAVHAIYLAVSRFMPTQRLQALIPAPAGLRPGICGGISMLVFFHLTVIAWIPFRSPNLDTTIDMVTAAFRFGNLSAWTDQADGLLLVIGLFGLHLAERVVMKIAPTWQRSWPSVPRIAIGVAAAAAVLIISIGSVNSSTDFIYFHF